MPRKNFGPKVDKPAVQEDIIFIISFLVYPRAAGQDTWSCRQAWTDVKAGVIARRVSSLGSRKGAMILWRPLLAIACDTRGETLNLGRKNA